MNDCLHFAWVEKGIRNFFSQVLRASEIEIDQIFIAEVILDAPRARRDYWLSHCETLENPGGCIQFGENIAVIRHNAEIAAANRFNDLLQISRAEIMDVSSQAPLAD